MAPPIRACLRTVVLFQNGGLCLYGLCTLGRNQLGVLRVTGSLLHLVLACRLVVLFDCSSYASLHVLRSQ